jgi:signal transduction histidine kinase
VKVEVEGDPVARGDARLASQAVVPLVSNAVRAFPRRGGTVAIRARSRPGGGSALEVHDDGPGIPETVRGRLFRPLVSGRAESGGNGLGLFIVRQAARRLRGTIRLRTGPKGTLVQMLLPGVHDGGTNPTSLPTAVPAAASAAGCGPDDRASSGKTSPSTLANPTGVAR